MDSKAVKAMKADHPARAQGSLWMLHLKGSHTGLPGVEVLTVDVLDEACGAGHIVHFDLSQGCTGQPRGRPVARRRDPDRNPRLTCTSIAATRRKSFRVTPPTSGIVCSLHRRRRAGRAAPDLVFFLCGQ